MQGLADTLCVVFGGKGIFCFLLALLGAVVSQYSQPLSAGTNYQTSDHSRREVVDKHGNIQGQYSYVDPSGSTVSVKYLAGKDGYKILNEPNQQQFQSQPQSHQVPVSFHSQKSGKPLRRPFHRQPQAEIQERDYQQVFQKPLAQKLYRQPEPQQLHQNLEQQQIYQPPSGQQTYQELFPQQIYQKPTRQQAYQQPLPQQSFDSLQNAQFDLEGFQQAFQPVQDYQVPQYQPKYTQISKIPHDLFSPAEHPYPAYTAGQVKSMRDFFEEERQEMEKMKRESESTTRRTESGQSGKSYVSVQNTNQGYSYDINL